MTDAVDVMLAFGSVSPSSMCLRTVYRAEAIAAGAAIPAGYHPETSAEIPLGSFEPQFSTPNAITDFGKEPGRRVTNGRDARRNETVYFRPDHVAIAVGDGVNVITTDFGQTKPHMKTIASIESSYGPVAGVSSTFGGHPIANIGAAPAAPQTAPTVSGSNLQHGSHGAEVEALQKKLNKSYPLYSKLKVDGIFGDETEKVVREFQKRAGLKVDGVVGPATKKALGI